MNELSNKLEQIIDENLDKIHIPYKKGNSIRIKNYVIRKKNENQYKIFNCKTGKPVHETFCQPSAIAWVNATLDGSGVHDVVRLDKLIQKHYIDCIFYRNTLRTATDATRKMSAEIRFDISRSKALQARHSLNDYIFYKKS